MNFYFISEIRTLPGNRDKLNWFEAMMFHGKQLLPFRDADPRVLIQRPVLCLWRNTYYVPKLFAPHNVDLIVHDDLAQKLKDSLGVLNQPVIFGKCFECPYQAGRHTTWDRWPAEWDEEDEFILSLPDSKPPPEQYFELLVPRTEDVVLPDAEMVTLPERFDGRQDVPLSSKMMKEHPITWSSGYIMSERAAKLCLPVIDRTYFDVSEHSVRG